VKPAKSRRSPKTQPVALANRNPFAEPAFQREYAATRARHAFPSPVPRPEPPAPKTSGRKTSDCSTTYRPHLPYPIAMADEPIR